MQRELRVELEVFIALDICLEWGQYMDMVNATWGADARALGWDYRFFTFLNPSCYGGDIYNFTELQLPRTDLVTIDRRLSDNSSTPRVVMPWTQQAVVLKFGNKAAKTLALVRYGMEWGLCYRPRATHIVKLDMDSYLCPATMGCILGGLPRSRLVWARFQDASPPRPPIPTCFAFSRDVTVGLVQSFAAAAATTAATPFNATAAAAKRLRMRHGFPARVNSFLSTWDQQQGGASLHVVDDRARVGLECSDYRSRGSYCPCWPRRANLAKDGLRSMCMAFCRNAVHAHVKNLEAKNLRTGFFWLHALMKPVSTCAKLDGRIHLPKSRPGVRPGYE